jgi:hypothetical protein
MHGIVDEIPSPNLRRQDCLLRRAGQLEVAWWRSIGTLFNESRAWVRQNATYLILEQFLNRGYCFYA